MGAMKFRIIGTESLGVRSMCCVVETSRRRVLIDPGVALAPFRFGLPPHKLELERASAVREAILHEVEQATDIIISHFHGDHAPLAEPDPTQVPLGDFVKNLKQARLWIKSRQGNTRLMEKRYIDFVRVLGERAVDADGKDEGDIVFSLPVSHGEEGRGTVMMSCLRDGGEVFVHASDTQLLDEEAVTVISNWKPDVVFVDGPPVYLSNLTPDQIQRVKENAKRLAQNAGEVIIDHHLLRSITGLDWLRDLAREGKRVILSGAERMGLPIDLLEAHRRELHQRWG